MRFRDYLNLQRVRLLSHICPIKKKKDHYKRKSIYLKNRFVTIKNDDLILSRLLMHNIKLYLKTANLHKETFAGYKNKYNGQDMVLMGCGPSVNFFEKPCDNAKYVGLNRAFMLDSVTLDFLFSSDFYKGGKELLEECFLTYKNKDLQRFYGIHDVHVVGTKIIIPESVAIRHGAKRFYMRAIWEEGLKKVLVKDEELPLDISCEPLSACGTIALPAMQFMLYTNPKRIFIAGCDCSNNGHFNDPNFVFDDPEWKCTIQSWKLLKTFVQTYYPETEIISINPVNLKGLFRDVYTKSYFDAHPELIDDIIKYNEKKDDKDKIFEIEILGQDEKIQVEPELKIEKVYIERD